MHTYKFITFVVTTVILLSFTPFVNSAFGADDPQWQDLAFKIKKPKISAPKDAVKEVFKKKVLDSCEFELQSIEPKVDIGKPKISLKGIGKTPVDIIFMMKIAVTNNSDIELFATKVDLDLFTSNEPIPQDVKDPTAKGAITEEFKVPLGETVSFPAEVTVPPEKATVELGTSLQGEKVHYRVDGTFHFQYKGFEIPITVTLTQGTK